MHWKRVLVAAALAAAVGCGSDKKADIPTDLNKQPPPPGAVATGGGAKPAKAPQQPSNTAD